MSTQSPKIDNITTKIIIDITHFYHENPEIWFQSSSSKRNGSISTRVLVTPSQRASRQLHKRIKEITRNQTNLHTLLVFLNKTKDISGFWLRARIEVPASKTAQPVSISSSHYSCLSLVLRLVKLVETESRMVSAIGWEWRKKENTV